MSDKYDHYGGGSLLESADDDDRRGFITKVYALLSIMLGISFGSVTLVMCNEDMRVSLVAEDNSIALAMFFTCLVVQLILNCCIICVKSCARAVPMNYIMLTIFTGCWAYILTYICA